jgi:hypothetical protein
VPTCEGRQTTGDELVDRGDSGRGISRRTVLKLAGTGLGASTLGLFDALAWLPRREALAAAPALPDIQFAIGDYIAPAFSVDGVLVRFGPVFTLFVTAKLRHSPREYHRRELSDALATVERVYSFSADGVFTFVAYGIPYFDRLPGGIDGAVVRGYMPRLLSDPDRYALEEAVPGPTDVSAANPHITKQTFNTPVVIESNDMLLTLRSDSLSYLHDVMDWLTGSGHLRGHAHDSPDLADLLDITSVRVMFQQMGLPRKVANTHALPFAGRVNPQSPMWMGFADQQVDGSGPPAITTFTGNTSARLTDADHGDYFDNGAIQHLSHVILDLGQFYENSGPNPEPYTERVQYMFRSNPIPSVGNTDQFADGGGPSFFDNVFQGTKDAEANAKGIKTFGGNRRMGHLAALQRSSRASDGTPMHIRMDGPGFDALDVPDGSSQPKLQFTAFVPTADFFTRMRRHQASLDLVKRYGVQDDDNGLERFTTATRRQNFLVPPRRHRAFPMLELEGDRRAARSS